MNQNVTISFNAVAAALAGVLLLWLPVLLLKLTAALFAFLTVYSGIRMLEKRLDNRYGRRRSHVWISVCAVLAASVLLLYALGAWLEDRSDAQTADSLLLQAAVILDQLHAKLPAALAQHIPASVENLKTTASQALKDHAVQFQTAGIHTLREIGHIVAGMIIGVIAAMQIPAQTPPAAKPLAARLRQEFDGLTASFGNVFFAQIRISAINTALTALYLLAVLPLIGKPLPMAGALIVLTFAAGLLPVVGNLISNAFIVILSLSHGLGLTLFSLAWLVGIHKLEYFLNAHIIGHKIKAAAWELLIAMLLMEAAFGLAGLIAAPVIYAQIKKSLVEKNWI